MDRSIAQSIVRELDITEEDFEKRKKFLQIKPRDIELIRNLHKSLGKVPESIYDGFYEHLMAFEETKAYFSDEKMIERLKKKQLAYFEELLSGIYDWNYLLSRLSIGYIHVRLNIVPLWYIGAYNRYIEEIRKVVWERIDKDRGETMRSLLKVMMLDMVLTLESYHYTKYKLQEKLEQMSVTDDLTGTYNRRKLEEVLQNEMDHSVRSGNPLTMLMTDIDHFKNVNDTYGHDVGDAVLVAVAALLGHRLRETDTLIRFGGEEFIILIPGVIIERAMIIAERLRQTIEDHSFETVGRITVSIGVAEHVPADNRDSFIKRADEKLYEAKQSGRNRICG